VITHPSVAGAAMLAGLIVAGGSYAARHDVGLGNGLGASAAARASLERKLPLGREGRGQSHQLTWHPPHVPKIHVRSQAAPSPVMVSAAPVTTFAAPAPVAASQPVTRTSPVGGDDGSGDGGGDD
jgi:hypothetical protein